MDIPVPEISKLTSKVASDIASGSFISPAMLWTVYSIAILVTVLLSAALLYHWKQYGFGDRKVRSGRALYLAGVIAIVVCAGGVLLYI